MPVQLTVGGQTYAYPISGESPAWGSPATAWAQAVTLALTNVQGTGDILQSSANIANNQSAAASISGLFFDPSRVRGADITYSIYRVTTSTGATELAEFGKLFIVYANSASSGSKWVPAQYYTGSSGVTFSILDTGQVQYVSSNITGSSYSGTIKFMAKALLQ